MFLKEKNVSKMIRILFVLAFIGAFLYAPGSAEVADALSKDDDGYYEIKTLQDFAEYSQIIRNGGSGTKARMMADVDVKGESNFVISTGTGDTAFVGEFDGNGHKISNVTASSGLFSEVAEGGIVKNLTVKITSVVNNDQFYVGGIANESLGTIENCTVECGDIQSKSAVGAIAGTNKENGTIANCTVKIDGNLKVATSNSSARYSGGVVGYNRSGTVKGCRAYGEGSISVAEGDGACGGIAGWNSSIIESCICEGSLQIHNNEKDYSGGIAGQNSGKIDDCLVYGDVEVGFSGNGYHVAGLVARMTGGTCSNSFYNSSKPPMKDAHPIVSDRKDGTITDCYYNTASGCTAGEYGTAISDINWLKCDSKITATIHADDKKTFAGREFVYSGKDVTLSYDGLANNQSVNYSVNGEEIDGNAFKMPQQETIVKARAGIAMSTLEDLKKGTVYSGSGQSPGIVQCSAGRIEEGKDYTVTKYQDSSGQETTVPPTDADTYIATIRGINKYAGNTTIEFKIVKADPVITEYPEALEPMYNGEEQELVTAGVANGGTILYRLTTEDESSSNEKIPTAKDAGKHDILYKVKGDKNHNDLNEQKLQAEIKKAKITISADDKSSKAGEAFQDLTYKVSGDYVEGDDLGITVSTDADKDKAGTHDIKVDWNNNKNYEATLVNGKYTVTAAPTPAPPAPKTSGTPLAKATVKKKSMTIGWNKITGAEGYDIFFATCNHSGKKIVCKNVKTIKGNKTFKWTKSGLKRGTPYKFYVRAYVTKNGKKTYASKSPLFHAYTGNGTKKYTNAKSVKLKNVKKGKLSLKQGKTFKIKAKVNKVNKKKKLMPKSHAPTLRYMTSDSKVATVSKSGKITAKGKGTCYIVAFAHNGVSKSIKIKIK